MQKKIANIISYVKLPQISVLGMCASVRLFYIKTIKKLNFSVRPDVTFCGVDAISMFKVPFTNKILLFVKLTSTLEFLLLFCIIIFHGQIRLFDSLFSHLFFMVLRLLSLIRRKEIQDRWFVDNYMLSGFEKSHN